VWIISEVADVIDGRDEVQVMPLPFTTEERLVPWDGTGRERHGTIVIVTKEAKRSIPDKRFGLPCEKVVIATRKSELTPTFRREFVDRREIDTLDQALAGVLIVGVDTIKATAVWVAGNAKTCTSWFLETALPIAAPIRI